MHFCPSSKTIALVKNSPALPQTHKINLFLVHSTSPIPILSRFYYPRQMHKQRLSRFVFPSNEKETARDLFFIILDRRGDDPHCSWMCSPSKKKLPLPKRLARACRRKFCLPCNSIFLISHLFRARPFIPSVVVLFPPFLQELCWQLLFFRSPKRFWRILYASGIRVRAAAVAAAQHTQ